MTIENPQVVDNRDATREDAKSLARIYHVLNKTVKAVKKATREVADGWLPGRDIVSLREARDEAVANADEIMDTMWEALNGLPKGTVAPGGATPQTVGLQFFNRNLNRTLGERITAKDARDANRRSFG